MTVTLEYESFQDFANRLWPCLSEEGMWIPSDSPAKLGETVDFDVMLADGFRLFHGSGNVVAVGPDPVSGSGKKGMTLRFAKLDHPSRNLVRKVVSKHIGEGGELFDFPGGASEGTSGDAGAEPAQADSGSEPAAEAAGLEAPFAELEGDGAWSGEEEPELKSFLRSSSSPTGAAASEEQFELEAEPTQVQLPEEPEVEPPAAGPSAGFWVTPDDVADEVEPFQPSEPSIGGFGKSAGGEGFADSRAHFDLAATQRIEPFDPGSSFGAPMDYDAAGVEPRPSTVVPPALSEFDDTADIEGEREAEDLDFDDHSEARGGRAWWPYVVVGGLAVGIGLYAVTQLDTPLSRFFGGDQAGDATPSAVTPRRAPSGPVTPEPQAATTAAEETSARSEDGGETTPEAASDATGMESSTEPGAAAEAPRRAPTPVESPVDSMPTPRTTPRVPAASPPADETEGDDVAAVAALSLAKITWREVDGDTVIRLALEGPVTEDRFETLRVAGGSPREVLKILGTQGGVPRDAVPIGSELVQQLRFGIHVVDGQRQVHVVVDLAAEGVQLVGSPVLDGDGLELRFGRP